MENVDSDLSDTDAAEETYRHPNSTASLVLRKENLQNKNT